VQKLNIVMMALREMCSV